jgi:hypothetical protein
MIITIATSANHDVYSNSYFQSKIFTATGTHLEAMAFSVSSKSYFTNIEVQLEKIAVGGTSSSGGSSDLTLFGAKISITNKVGTVLSQTSDFIESITHFGGNSNNYDITFKDGIFTEAPIVTTSTFNTSGSYAETISINSPETTDYINGKKVVIKFELVSNASNDFNSNTVGTYIADLIFMKSSAYSSASSASSQNISSPNQDQFRIYDL